MNDLDSVQAMQTNIEDDYILRIFSKLVQSKTNILYGLFNENHIVAMAGYTLYPGGYAMLGRLRSDMRYHSKGHATEILSYVKNKLEQDPSIKWIGANTNFNNKPARRVLEKIGFTQLTKLHSIPVKNKPLLSGTPGEVWTKVTTIQEKRQWLETIKENALGNVYPFECFYPFPFTQSLLPDQHLHESAFYQNPTNDRFLIIRNDQKGDWFAQVKYFWNDHFKQPGFWETVYQYIEEDPIEDLTPWLDFSEQGYANIPNIEAFDDQDAWVLYGKWTEHE